MRKLRMGTNITVFLLFFGVALLDALRGGHWLRAAFWFVIGLVFLLGDTIRQPRKDPADR